MSKTAPFIELNDYWLSITREDFALRGYGKWMLSTDEPHQLYKILKEEMKGGGLSDSFSVKTREEPKKGAVGEVYVFTAPYTDREKVLRVAEELKGLNEKYNFDLLGPLLFKTDLHNTWWRNVSRPGDGYHELLEQQNWIYKYQGGKLVVNGAIEALHKALENPPPDIDQEFQIIRSMLPEELYAGEESKK
ncbi:MAG: hypothetical protein KAH12_08335 [Anaerolineales bacterium]|nr:hypothetical protein [Anaerolineales bacterium]